MKIAAKENKARNGQITINPLVIYSNLSGRMGIQSKINIRKNLVGIKKPGG